MAAHIFLPSGVGHTLTWGEVARFSQSSIRTSTGDWPFAIPALFYLRALKIGIGKLAALQTGESHAGVSEEESEVEVLRQLSAAYAACKKNNP